MGFKKGEPRPEGAGRKPGSKNKRRSVLEVCEEQGLDPFAEMAKIAKSQMHERQFDALKELCQYLEPKKKAVEVTGSLDVGLMREVEALAGMTEEELRKLLKEELKK